MQRRDFARPLAAGAAALLLAALSSPASAADSYPSRPIKVIVPYAPGGVVDVQTRAVTQTMEQFLKQSIVVEPRPGASGSIAAEAVAQAAPDGYTLIVSASFINTAPLLEKNLRWRTDQFVPVGRFALSPSYFVVPASSPAKTVKEFVEMARKSPTTLQYANGGNGTPQQIGNELFAHEAGIKLDPVMYKGAPPSVPDLINGLTALAVLPSSVTYPQVKGGKLRALANMSSNRSPQLPDVPTIAEAGYPGSTVLSWYGLSAPAGTPPEVIRVLATAMQQACATPEVKQRLVSAGGEEAFLGTADFSTFLAKDARNWAEVVKVIAK
ncbi:tripartite tricarboxylate transporter substrate binding protein [Ottowia sp.]|uniref:tripartite tricarboxylate transporter substrate binding protein n=1 Tax=Ottowia sp. TaxID=1898956 RepID=UPI002BAC037C|nr:tripartite tricarboxylate transporter substrate binding protein [Ottowia sp.]MCP5259706.1 tripartite tricarboxylate transporter substrate binding protein [Burkholderiaceae bacterium]HRW73816.1 tripartite tricarboxylate transporter substrate binding protein [Ottowia sp.]